MITLHGGNPKKLNQMAQASVLVLSLVDTGETAWRCYDFDDYLSIFRQSSNGEGSDSGSQAGFVDAMSMLHLKL